MKYLLSLLFFAAVLVSSVTVSGEAASSGSQVPDVSGAESYTADVFVFYFTDDTHMLVQYEDVFLEGFTYRRDDSYLYVAAPPAEDLGFYAQVWEIFGREKWPLESQSNVQGDIAWAEPILSDSDIGWRKEIYRIACKYHPEMRGGETIFYGASNFNYWRIMEEDLQPYAVQNHAFGGSTDRDLMHWAEYMLYPYQPKIIFFQTGSNDYVKSKAKTEDAKVAEAMKFKKAMFEKFHKKMPDAKMVVMSGILLPGRPEYVNMTLNINDQLKALAEEKDYLYYVDAESLTYIRGEGFVDHVEDLFISDAIHLTPAARRIWAEKWILPVLKELQAPLSVE